MKYTWEFFSGRRKLTLVKFLRGVKNLEEAKQKFEVNQIIPPSDDAILSVIIKESPLRKVMKERAAANADQPTLDKTQESSSDGKKSLTKNNKKKKYFRKVLSPKSGEPDE